MKKDKNKDEICSGFSKMMVQEFLQLRRRAEKSRDAESVKSLDIIIAGITELTRSVADYNARTGRALKFNAVAFDIMTHLAKYPNDPMFLRRAGAHYLVEWQLPHIAASHFKRALSLKPSDQTLPMLIEIATLAVKRKNDTSAQISSTKMVRFLDEHNKPEGV